MRRFIWDYNIKMYVKDIEWEVIDFIHVNQDSGELLRTLDL